MPNVQYEVDSIAVENELRARHYEVHGQRAFGIQITVADPTKQFKWNGAPHRRLLPGVSKEVYRAIRRMSASAEEAADRVIAVSNGEQWDPNVGQAPSAPALSEAVLERIVGNRVDAVVAQRTAELDRRAAELEARAAQLAEQKPEKAAKAKKGTFEPTEKQKAHYAKLAAKNKARAAAAKAANEPLLTEEQEEMAKKAGIPLA